MSDTGKLHDAFVKGDLVKVRELLGDPPAFPNCRGPSGFSEHILEYAIYWSPVEMVCELLDLGADPNYADSAGFPSLIAALSSEREDRLEIVKILLDFGAEIAQRGVNDYTPLHWACSVNDWKAVELLLARGADTGLRTRIDDCETPLEIAERAGYMEIGALLRKSGQ